MSISQERIKELAHRRATKYTHRSAPHESAFGFTDSHLDDLCRDIHAAIEAECRKVPAGYVPVPVEPTASQLDVAVSFALNVKLCNDYNWSAYMRDVYARMIAAAPKPAEPEGREHLPDGCGLIHEPVAQEPAEWECFEDTSYYNMWAVRPVGEMQWGKCFHLANNAEAETLCAVLNMQPDKSAEVEKWKDELRVERNWSGQQRERIAELEAEVERLRDHGKKLQSLVDAGLDLCERKDKRIAELEAALREAKEMVESWGAYASPYFQAKHDLVGDIATIDKVLGGNAKVS